MSDGEGKSYDYDVETYDDTLSILLFIGFLRDSVTDNMRVRKAYVKSIVTKMTKEEKLALFMFIKWGDQLSSPVDDHNPINTWQPWPPEEDDDFDDFDDDFDDEFDNNV
jgi:hypothetical protein